MLNETKKSSKKKKVKKGSSKRPRAISNHTSQQSPKKLRSRESSQNTSKLQSVRKLSPGADQGRRSVSAQSEKNSAEGQLTPSRIRLNTQTYNDKESLSGSESCSSVISYGSVAKIKIKRAFD